jgi:hypothetical protein
MRKDLAKIAYKGHQYDWERDKNPDKYAEKIHPDNYEDDKYHGGRAPQHHKKSHYIDYSLIFKALKTKVGLAWDKVYSEILQANKFASSEAKTRFKDIVDHIVKKDIIFNKEGKPKEIVSTCGLSFPLSNKLYVHPKTKILSYAPKTKTHPKPKPITKIDIGEGWVFELIEGLWYKILYQENDYSHYSYHFIGKHEWNEKHGFSVVEKLSCGKKELKQIKELLEKNG